MQITNQIQLLIMETYTGNECTRRCVAWQCGVS